MAYLHNVTRALRLTFLLADREMRRPGSAPAAPERLLARISFEHLDAQDGEYWPFVRLPPYWLLLSEAHDLLASLQALLRGASPGFQFRSQASPEMGLQLAQAPGGRHVVELGVDLKGFLRTYSGTEEAEGDDLALFRFTASQAELVAFGDALRTELDELLARELESR